MFCHFGKTSKIQNGRHFWGGEIFLKIVKMTFVRYPVGRKFNFTINLHAKCGKDRIRTVA